MDIDRSLSELEETKLVSLSQDMGVELEIEVTAESQASTRHSNSSLSGLQQRMKEVEEEEEEEEKEKVSRATTERVEAERSRKDEEPASEVKIDDERMDEVKENVEVTMEKKEMEVEETRKRGAEKEVEPVLRRLESVEPSCSSDVIRVNKDQFKIGRKMDNDEVIVSVLISRNHCILQRDKDTDNWSVINLSSTDTLLNEKPIERNETRLIKHGDILQLSLSDAFTYEFLLVDKKPEPLAKSPRLESSNSDLGNVLDKQRCFVEWQKNERKDIEKQLADKQQEQEQLKEELDKLLEDQKFTKTCNEELNNQIRELREKIDVGSKTELELQEKYSELLEKLEEEKLKFEEKLAEEKQRWQEALKESKQEQEKLKMTYAEQIEEVKEQVAKKQQEEWQRKIDSLLQDEKNIQSKLQNEKQLLEQKLKQIQEDMQKKEEAAKLQEKLRIQLEKQKQQQLQQIQLAQQQQQQQQLQRQPQVLVTHQQRTTSSNGVPVMGKCVYVVTSTSNGTKTVQKQLPVLDTIDLTKDGTSTSTRKSGQDKEAVNKVNTIMDRQLTCGICSEYFVRAMTLNCMHTFCKHCIDSWSKRKRECPNCRATITHMTRSLVVDNLIEEMLESFTPEQMQKRKQLVQERQRLSVVKNPPRHGRRR